MSQNNAPIIRTHLRRARQEISVADRQRGSLLIRARLFTWLAIAREQALIEQKPIPHIIAAYWPLQDEPDLKPLIEKWLIETEQPLIQVALPLVVGDDAPLQFYPYTSLKELVPDRFGVMSPQPLLGQAPLVPDVVLVPTLGYTEKGDRIGYGKGFYDRTLSQLRQQNPYLVTIGIAWDEGRIESIEPTYQAEPHDFRLDMILTPNNWWPSTQSSRV